MTEIAEILRNEVQRRGVLPFVEFMRLALYCPKYGYYEQSRGRIGREGDFYTSVSTGSLFGELLAFQFAQWLEALPSGPLQLVEAGAHDGQLAADILGWLRKHRPELLLRVEYWLVEPSSLHVGWQKEKLEKFAERVRWFDSLAALPSEGIGGIIFSNELLDAMPVHRLGWDARAGRWFEWGVTLACSPSPLNGERAGVRGETVRLIPPSTETGVIWQKIPRSPDYFADHFRQAGFDMPAALLAVLPDEFTIEICPEAATWWQQAARKLHRGKLITIDYGFPVEHLLAPERPNGTLRAYHRHHASSDLLANPGQQDLTAHVNFTHLQRAGEAAGLQTEGLFSQERFLTGIAARTWSAAANFGEWTPARKRQLQTLTHPEHLGRPFSVLVQGRAWE